MTHYGILWHLSRIFYTLLNNKQRRFFVESLIVFVYNVTAIYYYIKVLNGCKNKSSVKLNSICFYYYYKLRNDYSEVIFLRNNFSNVF